MSDIRIYTTAACGYCHAAKSLLKRAQLPYEEIDLTMDLRGRDALVRRTGRRTFPQVLVDGQPIGGYQELTQAIHAGDLRPLHPQAA
jgi:glutaredoxin 3